MRKIPVNKFDVNSIEGLKKRCEQLEQFATETLANLKKCKSDYYNMRTKLNTWKKRIAETKIKEETMEEERKYFITVPQLTQFLARYGGLG